jgi:hypothetical protein
MDYEYDNNDSIEKLAKEEKISYEEAIPLYFDRYFKHIRRDFEMQTNCIYSMFERIFYEKKLYKIYNNDFCKILILCQQSEITKDHIVFGEVLQTYINYNVLEFFKLSEIDKKKEALKLLSLGFNSIKSIIDINPLLEICHEIEKKNYNNRWKWKSKCTPSGKYEATIEIVHGVYSVDINMNISDKKYGTIKTEHICSTLPSEWYYYDYLGDLKLDNKKISLFDKKGRIVKNIIIK